MTLKGKGIELDTHSIISPDPAYILTLNIHLCFKQAVIRHQDNKGFSRLQHRANRALTQLQNNAFFRSTQRDQLMQTLSLLQFFKNLLQLITQLNLLFQKFAVPFFNKALPFRFHLPQLITLDLICTCTAVAGVASRRETRPIAPAGAVTFSSTWFSRPVLPALTPMPT